MAAGDGAGCRIDAVSVNVLWQYVALNYLIKTDVEKYK